MRWLSRSPKYPLLAAVSYTLGLLFVIEVLRFLPGAHTGSMPPHAVLVLLALFIVLAMLAFGLSWFYGLGISVSSLRLRSWSGRYVDVPWHGMQRVERKAMMGFPLLLVYYVGAARPAFIPLWVSDLAGFRTAADAAGGQANPVVRWLAEHPRAGRYRWF
jgi:hypothetical protein